MPQHDHGCCPPIVGFGIDAADEILKSVYGVDVRKALDPLNHQDFEKICAHLASELKGIAQPIESAAYKKAIETLDVDWTKLTKEQRYKVLDAAKAHLQPLTTIPAKIEQSIEMNAKDIYAKSKSKAVLKYNLDIESTFSQKDEKAIAFISKSQGHYVRNAQGERVEGFSNGAKAVVQWGLDKGLGSADIAEKLALAGAQHGRTSGYWNMIAMVFANRARTTSQLQSYGEAGIQVYAWESVLDEATSVQCRFMHGRKFPVHMAIQHLQQVEDADDPEAIMQITPFMQLGNGEGGSQELYFGGRGGLPRQRAAWVEQNAVGSKNNTGKYSGGMSTADLAAAGITAPPLHGRCRSTIIPDFSPSGAITPASSLGFGGAPAPAPAFVEAPAKPDAKAAALAALSELPESGWGDGTVKGVFPSDLDSAYLDDMTFDQLYGVIDKHGKPSKKPKLADMLADTGYVDPVKVATFINSPKKLADATDKAKVIKYGGKSYIIEGNEALTAHKLLGKQSVSVNYTDIDAIPKSELPSKSKPIPPPTPPIEELKPAHVGPAQGQAPPGFAPQPKPEAVAANTADTILGTKIGAAQGSNEGGFYIGKDGVKRYVKFYTDPAQAAGEHLANSMYRDLLGHEAAAESEVFMHEGKICYASRIVEGVKTLGSSGITQARAKQAMDGFAADVLTGNWDAAGMTHDNMVITPSGAIMRVDNGGTFLMRAKAGRKPDSALNAISEWDVFFSNKNPAYSELASKAGYQSPADFKADVIKQIQSTLDLRDKFGGWHKYVDQHAPLLKGDDRSKVISMLEMRSTLLEQKMIDLRNMKAPPPMGKPFEAPRGVMVQAPPVDRENLSIRKFSDLPLRKLPYGLDEPPDGSSHDTYVANAKTGIAKATPAARSAINGFTDGEYGDMRERSQYATDAEAERKMGASRAADVKKKVEAAESAFGVVPSAPGQVFRGIRGLSHEIIDKFMQQDEISLLGMASTSRKADVSIENFMGGTTGDRPRALFVIHQKSAIPIETISDIRSEYELLTSARSRYRVLNRHRAVENKEAILIMEIEEIEGLVPIAGETSGKKPRARRSSKRWLGFKHESVTVMKTAEMLEQLPANWPKTGELKGKTIDLEEAQRTLSRFELACVIVDVPGVGRYQPWKGSDYIVTPDGEVKI